MRVIYILIINLIYASSCLSNLPAVSKSRLPDSVLVNNISIGYQNFKLVTPLIKHFDSGEIENKSGTAICENWTFEDKSLASILNNFRKVDTFGEAYKLCYQYPCWYEGMVDDGHVEYGINVYAGAYITLVKGQDVMHFILETKSDLFVSACDCCETDSSDK